MENDKFLCPNCKSENIQNFKIVYKGGVTEMHSESKAFGVGYASGHLGVAIGNNNTTGSNITNLAKEIKPPQFKSYSHVLKLGLFLIIISTFIIAFPALNGGNIIAWILGCIGMILGVLIYIGGNKMDIESREAYNENCKIWENSYICFRCGTKFLKV